jgi:hypothetical protein
MVNSPHIGLPAAGAPIVKDDGAGDVLRQYPLDLPHQLLAFLQVALDRLLLDQLVYVRIAVSSVVALRTADVILVECLVGLVEAVLADAQTDRSG